MTDGTQAEAQFQDLVTLCLEGRLSEEDRSRFRDLLSNSPTFVAHFRQQAMVHGMLLWHGGKWGGTRSEGVDPIAVAELLADAEREARLQVEREAAENARLIEYARAERRRLEEQLERSRRRRPQPIEIPLSVVYLGTAALAVCLFLVVSHFVSREDSDTVVAGDGATAEEVAPQIVEPILASLADSVEAELFVNDDDLSPVFVPTDDGAEFRAGVYSLDRGVVELEMRSGVKVLIEGPAVYRLVSEDRIRVERGRIVGNVSPESVGFTVETSYAAIVDLGTEFGVEVSMDEAVDVTVFDGEVEVVTSIHDETGVLDRRRLEVSESARVNQEGELLEAVVNDDRFFREVPDANLLAQKESYEQWLAYCRKLGVDSGVLAHYTFDSQESNDSELFDRASGGQAFHGSIEGATWEAGRWPFKQSLQFAGSPEDYVRLSIPGQYDALTIAAWVQIEELVDDYVSLVMCSDYKRSGDFHWQLLGNGQFHLGLLSEDGSDSQVTWESSGRVDARSLGKWLHIALVMHDSGKVDCYLDGANVGMVADAAPQQASPTMLNLEDVCLASWQSNERFAGETYNDLRGQFDELLIIDRAMGPQEIERLAEIGRP